MSERLVDVDVDNVVCLAMTTLRTRETPTEYENGPLATTTMTTTTIEGKSIAESKSQ